jgi:hypothetical protein
MDRDEKCLFAFRALIAGNALTVIAEVEWICAQYGCSIGQWMETAPIEDVFDYMHAHEAYDRIVKEEIHDTPRSGGSISASSHLPSPTGIRCGSAPV